jgi:hypothetical protein
MASILILHCITQFSHKFILSLKTHNIFIMLRSLPKACRFILEETGSSFIFGTSTNLVKNAFNFENNFFSKNLASIRRGVEIAEYSLLFNLIFLFSKFLRIKNRFGLLFSNLICSYLTAKRNGVLFAMKSLFFNLISNFIF